MPLPDRLSSLSAKDDLTKNRDSGDGGGTTPDSAPGENQMIQRCVIVQRDDKGYGLTVSGDNPVYVQSVKAEGAAARCGVQEGDKILKVNGTLVTNRNHIDVVKLIKSGPLVALTLLGKPPPNSLDKSATIITPQHLTSSSNRVTAPQPVDPEKDKELWQQKVHTIQAMCEQAREDHEKLKKSYVKNPSEKLNAQLLEKERTVKRLEEQLKIITGSGDISPSTPLSSMSDTDKSPMDQNSNTSWTSSLPSSVPTISDAGSVSDSPPTSPSISPTPSHPSNRHDVDNSSSSSKVDSGIEDTGLSNQTNIITIDDEDINSEEEITGDAGPFSDITTLEKKPAHLGIFLHYLISNSDPSPVFFYIISDQYNNAQGSTKDMRKWAYEIYSTFLAPNAPLSAGLGDNVITTIDSALTTNSGKTSNENALRSVFEPARNAVKGIIQDLLADFRQKKDLGLGSIYGTHELRDDMDKQSESKMIEKYLMTHLSVLVGEDKSDREQAMGWALATFLRQTVTSKSSHTNMMERVQSFVMKDKRSIKFPITKTKTKAIKGHQFTLQHYYMVTFCASCNSLIWGVGYQGYQCNSCEINVHRQCVDDFNEVCSGKQKKREKRASGMIPVIPSIRKFSNPNPSAGSSFTTVNEALREAANTSSDSKGQDIVTQPLKRDEEAEFAGLPVGHSVKSIVNRYERPSPEQPPGSEDDDIDEPKDKNKKKKEVGRSESMKGRMDKKDRDSKKRSKSDVDVDDSTIKALNQSGSSSTSSLGGDNVESVDDLPDLRPDEHDSDLDVENDLPTLKSIVGEEGLRKLKPKEKKRQEVLNELVHTERAHVRNLKILDRLFFRPMAAEPSTGDLAKQLLPNIHSMIRLHSSFNNSLKSVRKENPVIGEVGDIFLKRFDGEEGDIFKNNCATFCRGQSFALDALKKQQRKEQRLSQFLNDAESNPLCRRLQLKDLVPTQFQRLTKYPLLIENLLKYTQTNTDEYRKLTLAQKKTKEILAEVNQSVKEFENHQRLKILQKKMEKKIPQDSQESKRKQVHEDMKNLDLPQHKLVYEGELTWRLRPNRLIEMHVILLEDRLVLLQKQDEKLILKCQSLNVHNQSDLTQSGRETGKGYTHSPILRLQNLLSRNVATDKKAFFVINTSEAGPQIYELIATNQTSRKTWHNHINTWADLCKNKKSLKPTSSSTPVKSHVTTPQPEEITEIRSKITKRPPERLSQAETNTQDVTPREDSEILETAQVRTEPELARPTDVKVSNLVVAQSKPVLTPLEQMKNTDFQMNELLIKKEKLMSSILNFPLEEYRTMSEPSDSEVPDSRYLLAAAIRHMDDFTRLISAGCDSLVNQPQDSTHSNKGPGVNVPIPMSQLKEMAAKMNSILTNLLSAVGSTEEERDKLRVELKAAQDQLNVLREIQRSAMVGEQCSSSRPASMVSVASSVSEHGETTEGETDDDTAQESDQEMIEHHNTELMMEAEHPDSEHDLDPDPYPDLDNHDTDNKQTSKEDEDSSEVDPVYEDAVEKIVADKVQQVNSAPTDSKMDDKIETHEDKQSSHVTSDGQVINHVMESENEVVLEQVTMSESCDYDNDTKIPLNQSECLDNSSNNETVVVDSNEPVNSENPKSTNSETPQINSIVDSIEGANFSDSDSTVTPVPYFSEMGDSEIDNMAKSDATLVGSINSILSDTDSSHDPPNSCDVSCDSQRTNENEEPVQSDQSNKPSGIEL